MKQYYYSSMFVMLVLLQICFSFASVDASVEELCDNLQDSIATETCIDSFSRDPRSQTTSDNHKLAIISVDIVIAEAKSVQSDIQNALQSSPSFRTALQHCLKDYSDGMQLLVRAEKDINTKDARSNKYNYKGANDLISKYASVLDACDHELPPKGEDNPVFKEEFQELGDDLIPLALAVTSFLDN